MQTHEKALPKDTTTHVTLLPKHDEIEISMVVPVYRSAACLVELIDES
jgi:hypothetical protein